MKLLWFLFLSNIFSLFAQAQNNITGSTRGINQEPIVGASITCKTANNILAYTFSDNLGQYKLTIPANNQEVQIIASALGYAKDSTNITAAQLSKGVNYIFILKAQAINLNEVNINIKDIPIVVKKDTTIFNVDSFTDGTESVVEDILKKLPGMEVSDNGDLKFKGKKIDEVQFEGDNLLGNNYKLGTKNITARAIDKVQAIENYSNTTLLKGIKKGNKTVLNLQLKNNFKKPIAVNVNVAGGIKDKYDGGVNVISIAKKFKGFLLANANNIGDDNTPYNAFMDVNDESDVDLVAQPLNSIISNKISYPELPEKRYNFNNKVLFSPVGMYKFSDRLKLKLNGSYAFDKNYRSVLGTTNYFLQNELLSLLESKEQHSQNHIYDGNAELLFKASERTELRYVGKITSFYNNANEQIFANEQNLAAKLTDRNNLLTNNILFLKRLNSSQALSIEVLQANNKIPQNYWINTKQFGEITNKGQQDFIQFVNNQANNLQVKAKLIGLIKKINYELKVGSLIENQKFMSTVNINDNNANNFENQLSQNQFDYYIGGYTLKQFGNFTLGTTLNLHQLKINLINGIKNITSKLNKLYLEPKLNISFSPNQKNNINLSYNHSLNNYSIDNLYQGYILTDYRSFSNNANNFGTQTADNIGLSYAYNDFFEKQFQFFILTSYTWNNNNIGTKLNLQPNYTLNTDTLFAGRNFFMGVLNISKYIDAISSTIKLNSSVNIATNINMLNAMKRSSRLFSAYNNLSLKTFIGNHFTANLGTKGMFFYSKANQVQSPMVANLSSYYGITIKPVNKWLIKLSAETTWGDIYSDIQRRINFVDASVKYVLAKNKLTIELLANNIFNQQYFRNKAISDFESNTTDYRILPRTILTNIEYRFGK